MESIINVISPDSIKSLKSFKEVCCYGLFIINRNELFMKISDRKDAANCIRLQDKASIGLGADIEVVIPSKVNISWIY